MDKEVEELLKMDKEVGELLKMMWGKNYNILEIISNNMTPDEQKKYDDVKLDTNEFHIVVFQVRKK